MNPLLFIIQNVKLFETEISKSHPARLDWGGTRATSIPDQARLNSLDFVQS